MDRVFLEYYEDELTHLRELSGEFAALHPTVAGNLSLDTVPCPDPYVERLLEGVSFLNARTKLKVDAESSRFSRNILEALYPDLVTPAPAVSTVVLTPGPQVQTMLSGHMVPRGTRLTTGLKDGLATRCTFTTAQDVHLLPISVSGAEYLQDKGALKAAGFSDAQRAGAEAGLKIALSRSGGDSMAELAFDRLDFYFGTGAMAAGLFDGVFGHTAGVFAKTAQGFRQIGPPQMVGVGDDEAIFPRNRPGFEGYRLMREYFLMPERFHYMRLDELSGVLPDLSGPTLEIVVLFDSDQRAIADVGADDMQLFATPIVNLFEKECNIVELDQRRSQQVLHADRTRPRDFEIYRILSVEDADQEGKGARIASLFSFAQNRGSGLVYSTERRPRRPGEDEIRVGQTRATYAGDDLFISISRPAGAASAAPVKRLDIRALCSNRDLPLLDDRPKLSLESGDPVSAITLLGALKPPRASLPAVLPKARGGETRLDELSWRLIAQLSLNYLSLAQDSDGAEPLKAMLDIYADRGDPALARHIRSIRQISSKPVVERLDIPGPMCFGHGVEITLHVDENPLSGHSTLLLSGLLNKLFARHAGLNSFVRTKTRLSQTQEEISWPMTPGLRHLI